MLTTDPAPLWHQRWHQIALLAAVMLHGRASMRWTYPECQESFAPAVYGFPLPETQWAGFSLEWHLWLPAYLLNIAVLWVALSIFLVPLRRYKWMRSRGGIVGMLALALAVFPIVTKVEQPHIMPSAAFPIAGWQHLKAAGWSFYPNTYQCDDDR